jgi:hypothetical protein
LQGREAVVGHHDEGAFVQEELGDQFSTVGVVFDDENGEALKPSFFRPAHDHRRQALAA